MHSSFPVVMNNHQDLWMFVILICQVQLVKSADIWLSAYLRATTVSIGFSTVLQGILLAAAIWFLPFQVCLGYAVYDMFMIKLWISLSWDILHSHLKGWAVVLVTNHSAVVDV